MKRGDEIASTGALSAAGWADPIDAIPFVFYITLTYQAWRTPAGNTLATKRIAIPVRKHTDHKTDRKADPETYRSQH